MRARAALLALWLAIAGPGAAEAAAACAPWPGEPDPLPTTREFEALPAYWARLRAAELARAAEAFEEQGEGGAAYALWRHAACLDPDRPDLAAALARTRPLRVHRPSVARALRAALRPPASSLEEALAALGRPIYVAAGSGPIARGGALPDEPSGLGPAGPNVAAPPPARGPDAIDHQLEEADSLLQAARFDEALAVLAGLRPRIEAAEPEAVTPHQRARLEVLSATAAVAMGQVEEARDHFERALTADPELRLDPGTTSPKVLRVFEQAREARP